MNNPAFCIGNGPSLDNIDLDRFTNHITFAVNRIQLLYEKFTWRPDYYFIEDFDERNWHKMFDEAKFHAEQGYPCYLREDICDEVLDYVWPANVTFFPKCNPVHPRDNERGFGDDRRRWHLPEVCVFGGSGLVSIQYAVLMEYNPIYLVGHDGDYKLGQGSNFSGYIADGLGSEYYVHQRNRRLHQAHDACWQWCQEHDIEIYQTNPDSAFTQYPVVSLDEALS